MTRLNKLTLSNIRRFGEDVEINISDGATIILAPNGTGKTSIFEAIEFALTGRVKRLDYPPLAIIRDNCKDAKIRLDYNQGHFYEVDFEKGKEPIVANHHPSLFNGVDSDNIPYLLRLTHLLSQSSKEWFVQSKPDEAANQLNSLSIGKDATIANSSIVGLKRAAGNIVEKLESDFKEINEELLRWESLLEKRKGAISSANQNLIPRQEIIKQIVKLDEKVFPNGIVDQLPTLKSVIAQLNNKYSQSDIAANSRISNLSALMSSVNGFNRLLEERESIESMLEAKKQTIANIDERIKSNVINVEECRRQSSHIHSELQKFQYTKKLFSNIERIRNVNISLVDAKNSLEKEIGSLQKEYQAKDEEINKVKAKIESSKILSKEKLRLSEKKIQIDDLTKILSQWSNAQQEIDELNRNSLSSAEIQVTSIEGQLLVENPLLQKKREILESSQSALNRLVDSADKLKAAVSIIAENLSVDAKQCPACNTGFAKGELQEEVAKSLSRFDEDLEPAHSSVRIAKREFDEIEKKIKKLQSESANAKGVVQEIRNNIENLSSKINNEYRVKFEGKTYEESKQEVEKLQKDLTASQHELQDREVGFGQVPAQAFLDLLNDESNQIKKRLFSAQEELRSVQANIVSNEAEINTLNVELGASNFQENDTKISQANQQYEDINIKTTELEEVIKNDNALRDIELRSLSNIEAELRLLIAKIDETISKWNLSNLENTPDPLKLEEVIDEQKELVLENKRRMEILDNLLAEVIKWELYENYFAIENDIQKIVGQLSESEYYNSLKLKHEKKAQRLQSGKDKTTMLNAFSRNLDLELMTVNDKLALINPVWGKILTRLVVDPRFASTELHNYQSYRKNHARVNVPLHGDNVQVSHVASEAQITDVQFSFLLAMAQMYQWTPWKALLLDDPTQHHDLVHASAVFDLLRDYISDYNFQVVMATHDSVQAKFFKRKLENDGIPCNFYVLNATQDGVVANLN